MKFTDETLWLKDYYISRVNMEVRPTAEQEGFVRIKVGDGTNSSHLYVASENDDSGLTPRRFQADVEADMHELRNPKQPAPASNALETSGFKGVFSQTK